MAVMCKQKRRKFIRSKTMLMFGFTDVLSMLTQEYGLLDQVQLQPSIPKMEVRVEHIGFEGWSRALIVHDNTPIEVRD